MGYKRPAKHYKLTFAEPEDMAGFEVTMRRMSSDEFLTLTGLASDGIASSSGSKTAEAGQQLFGMLGAAVVSWNLEDDGGTPVPPSAAAVRGLGWEFLTRLTGAYLDSAG